MRTTSLKYILASIMMSLSLMVFAENKIDIIVTNDGESLKVYNLDYTPADFCYYTTQPESDELKRIRKSDVLIIKLADGTKVDLSDQSKTKTISTIHPFNQRNEITVSSYDYTEDKNGNRTVKIGDKNVLTLLIDSNTNNLEIIKAEINTDTLLIPEFVIIDSNQYTITKIGKKAFRRKDKISTILFPKTLTHIGDFAFSECTGLVSIILPENLEFVGDKAFHWCGFRHRWDNKFKELYLPPNLKDIGKNAFGQIGTRTSYRGYYQGYLTGLPSLINDDNCTYYGIDEEAVEAYQNRNK